MGEIVKGRLFAALFTMAITLMACQPLAASIPNETPTISFTPLPTNTPVPTATMILAPKITATPIIATFNTSDDLIILVKRLYPTFPCISMNYVNSSSMQAPTELEFIKVDIQPDPKSYRVSEIADNFEKSCQTFVACDPDFCQEKIYVKCDQTERVYEIDWEWRLPYRPIQWITWINNDTLVFFQSSNPDQGSIIVINVDKRAYVYAGIVFPDYICTTSTPTP